MMEVHTTFPVVITYTESTEWGMDHTHLFKYILVKKQFEDEYDVSHGSLLLYTESEEVTWMDD